MYPKSMYSSELLKGTLQTIILKILSDNGTMYGYEITQRVKELSDERILLTEGSLYPALHKLEAEDLLTTKIEFVGKRKRKYYRLTPAGDSLLTDKIHEFTEFVKTIAIVLRIEPAL